MSDELKREQDIRYLYENALGQIVSIGNLIKAKVPPEQYKETAFIMERMSEIANDALMHDFKAIYPDHTEEFHEEIRKRHA